jgi:hypothetical protein
MTVSSMLTRIPLRIRLLSVGRLGPGAPYLSVDPADELNITMFRRCDRSLIVAAPAPSSVLRAINSTLLRS